MIWLFGNNVFSSLKQQSVSHIHLVWRGQIVFDCRSFKYEIDSHCKNLHFIDKSTGIDYLKQRCSSLFVHQ